MEIKQIISELIVDNVEEELRFFYDKFDFQIDDSFTQDGKCIWARITNGKNKIMIQETEVTKMEISDFKERILGTDLLVLKLGSVSEIKAAYSRFVNEKDLVYKEMQLTEYGTYEFGVKDPEGRYILVACD